MSTPKLIDDWRRRGSPLEVPGANTVIWREGAGEAVVCLHGVPASGFVYRNVISELATQGLQGVTFDLPGLGFAARPRTFDYSWSGLAQWVVDALDAADIDRFHLLVHDLGGPVGFDVVRRIPQRIRSLTVLNTFVHVASFRRPWAMEPFAWPGVGWLWLQGMRTPVLYLLMRMLGVLRSTRNDVLRVYRELLFREDGGRAFLAIMRGFERTQDFEDGIVAALRDKAFPAQVVWGEQDPALKLHKHAAPVCEALGLDDFHRVRGKHFLQETSPVEIARLTAGLAKSA